MLAPTRRPRADSNYNYSIRPPLKRLRNKPKKIKRDSYIRELCAGGGKLLKN